MPSIKVGYGRVSTSSQSLESQKQKQPQGIFPAAVSIPKN